MVIVSASSVLILVLLGCGLLGPRQRSLRTTSESLNPCFVGMWSFSGISRTDGRGWMRLNPCFVVKKI